MRGAWAGMRNDPRDALARGLGMWGAGAPWSWGLGDAGGPDALARGLGDAGA